MHLVTVHDPFHPLRGREIREVSESRAIAELVPQTQRPFIVLVDGEPVLRQDWSREVDGDRVVVVLMLPQGGNAGKNILRVVGMIAVVALAWEFGPALGGLMGLSGAAATAVGTGVIMFGGSMLVNAVIPPPGLSNNSLASGAGSLPSPSPTYNLQAQGNTARLGQPIPVQYGSLRIYPDYAAQPYVEYYDNEQYLYQLFVIGQGTYDLYNLRIGDTDYSSFENVTYEVVLPGAVPTLFPANVTQSNEVSGQELITNIPVGPFVANNVATRCTSIGIDIICPRGLYYANDNGSLDARTVIFRVEVRTIDQLGGATGPWTTVNSDLHYTDWSPWVYYSALPPPADTNTEHYVWMWNYITRTYGTFRTTRSLIISADNSVTAATTTPVRRSFKFDVTALGNGITYPRFEVRLTRLDNKDTNARSGHDIDWSGMRAYMPGTTNYGDITLLAVKAQATNNLTSASARQINVSAIRRIPVVTPTGPGYVTSTTSVASALADIAMNTTYGGGMSVSSIDWAQLYALDQELTARGDQINIRFDSATTLWDALTQVGVVARTKPFLQGGVLHFMRDASASVPVALFSMRNIIQNSMSIQYLTPSTDTADYVQVTYFDGTIWQQTTVDCVLQSLAGTYSITSNVCTVSITAHGFMQGQRIKLTFGTGTAVSGVYTIASITSANSFTVAITTANTSGTVTASTDTNPAKIALMGITSRAQAFREGIYQAAANKYRRKVIKFSTEAEGFIPSFGDLIAIQHDIPAWGQVAEVTGWTAGTLTLTVNEDLTWTPSATHYIGMRKRDGSIAGPYVVTQGAASNVLVLATSPSFTPYTGTDEERTHIAFGPGDTWRQPARVVSVQPRGPYQVEITAINEDPSVHTAETGKTAPALNYSQLPVATALPVVNRLVVRIDLTGATPQYVASWDASPNADHYLVQISWDDGVSWTGVSTEYGTSHRWQANRNASATVRVAGVNLGVGAWSTAYVNFSDPPMTPTSLGYTVTLEADMLVLKWAKVLQMDVVGYEVRTSDTGWGTDGAVFSGKANSCSIAPTTAGTSVTYYLRSVDFLGNYSATSASRTFTVAAPSGLAGMSASVVNQQIQIQWAKPAAITTSQLSVSQFEVRTSDTGWGTASGYVFKGDTLSFLDSPPAIGVSRTYYARAIDVRGNYSTASSSVVFTSASVPNIASFAYTFAGSSTTTSTVTLSWTDVAPQFGLAGYQVTYGTTTVFVKANVVPLPADWLGDRLFTVQTIDLNGNISSGYAATVTKGPPGVPTAFRAQVIDNTVMLYWQASSVVSLPISHYVLRRGTSWSSYDVDYGRKDGLFTTINETQGGTYTYWIVAVDTEGRESTAASVSAIVAQPPDFVFFGQFTSTFTGTKSSALLESGSLVIPVSTTETYAAHFTSRSWASPQDQINAGYPVYIQPSSSPGYYEETFDFGTTLASSRVSVAYTASTVAGSPVIEVSISTSADGSTWLTNTGSTQIFATSFRYVKVRITVTDTAGTGIIRLSTLSVTLDAKLKNDAGNTSCVSTDASGTVANFGVEFIDVTSITVTPAGTTARTAVYDFLDSVITGTYSVTSNVCTVSATAHGLVAGQKVRLSFTSGTAPSGVYTVASVVNANSYTVALTTGNTSGNVSTYSQGMRIYLFDTSGTRVSGTASWAIKGY